MVAGHVVADSDPKAQFEPLGASPYTDAAGLNFTRKQIKARPFY